jgi:membrane protease YdiL (CAAX protease family)
MKKHLKGELTMSATTNTSVQTKESFVQRFPLLSFFLLAIGLTWIFMITDALGSHGILPFRLPLPLMVVMGYMPTLAAVIVAGQTQGKAGVRALFRRLLIVRVGIGWHLFAIFGLAVMYVVAILLYNQLSGLATISVLSERTPPFSSPIELVPQIAILFLIVGIVNGEELGWRGFALPRLQARYNALTSSLILGVIWTIFHLPLFFTVTGSSQTDWSITSFLISTIAMTVLYTWMFNNTHGSVFMAYLFHAAANTWSQVFSIDHANQSLNWIITGLLVLAAVVVVLTTGARDLSRKKARFQEEI